MAGLLITIGPDAKANHELCMQEYQKIKDLPLSYQEIEHNFCLSKFCRINERDDNILIHDGIKIWVIGTLIYKNSIGHSALEDLKQELASSRIEDLAKYLDGTYCLIIKNHTENGFWFITDHVGIMNLYKYQSDNTFAISTSSMALSRSFSVTPDREGVLQFLRNATICDSKTIYNEIELLEPASVYFIENALQAKIKSRTTYWAPPTDIIENISFEEARDFLAEKLLNRIELLGKNNIICDLTAGFDSRLILSAFLSKNEYLANNITTFVFGPDNSKEVRLVKQYCSNLGLQNHHLTLPQDWHEKFYQYINKALLVTDGEENVCVYAPILWAQEFKSKDFSLSINGLGGELYRDFWWIQEFSCSRRPANIDRLIDTRVLQYEYDYSVFAEYWKRHMLQIKNILKDKFINTNSEMDTSRTFNTHQIDNIYLRQKIRRWAGRTISSSNQIIRTVAPLTFKFCLEAGMSIPPRHKRNGKLVKAVVELLNPVLSEQVMLNGTPCQILSLNNFHRFFPFISHTGKKVLRKFSQKVFKNTTLLDTTLTYKMHTWYNAFLNDMNGKKLSYEKMRTRNLYQKKQFYKFIHDAQKSQFRNYQQLGNILSLELRMREDNFTDDFLN